MDDGFYTEILDENRPAVKEAVREAMLAGIKRKFEWELPEALNKAVSEFVTTEIVPEVRAQLLADKDQIVTAATDAVRGVAAEIGKAMQATAAKNLTNSYTLKSVVDSLFR